MSHKTVFVLGDSYSFHDGVIPTASWPARLVDYNNNITVINGSIPGSGLDCLFYRSLEMERTFGKPDLVLTLLAFPWRMWYMYNDKPLLNFESFKPRYHAANSFQSSYLVPNLFGDKLREQLLEQRTGQSMKDLTTLYKLQSEDHHQRWRAVKEITLLNSYYKNTVFMSWVYDYREWLSSLNVTYIGTVTELLGDLFEQCKKAPNDDHFSEHGHSVLAPIVYKRIKYSLLK